MAQFLTQNSHRKLTLLSQTEPHGEDWTLSFNRKPLIFSIKALAKLVELKQFKNDEYVFTITKN